MTKEIFVLLSMPKMEWIRETKRGGEKKRKVEEEKKRKSRKIGNNIRIYTYICIYISVDQREGREATRVQVSPKFFISLSSAAFS